MPIGSGPNNGGIHEILFRYGRADHWSGECLEKQSICAYGVEVVGMSSELNMTKKMEQHEEGSQVVQ